MKIIIDKNHNLEYNLIKQSHNPKIVIIDFNNILISFYYQFINLLSKFIITNFFADIKDIDIIYNKILDNFIRNNFIYFLRTKLYITDIQKNYKYFVNKYIEFLTNETNFSEKTIKYIEKYLNTNIIIPNKNPKLIMEEFIKLINYVIIFTTLKLFFLDFREYINNEQIILIFVIRDDFSFFYKNNTFFKDIIKYYYNNKILYNISTFLTNILHKPVFLAIKLVKKIDPAITIKNEIDDLHCLNLFIELYNNTNTILFSNDKYRKILSANLNFSNESLFISNINNNIIYNLYSINDTQNILNKLKYKKYLERYTHINLKYKNYSFGNINASVFNNYKKIIEYIIAFHHY
jgi:hypothetical protein